MAYLVEKVEGVQYIPLSKTDVKCSGGFSSLGKAQSLPIKNFVSSQT